MSAYYRSETFYTAPVRIYPLVEFYRQWVASYQMPRSGYWTPTNLIFDPASESAIYFGQDINGFAIGKKDTEEGHTIVFGASGIGKTTGIGVPTIRSWRGSIFAVDLKGDLVGWGRDRRRKVLYLLRHHKNDFYYDPFYCLRSCDKDELVPYARELAHAIIPLPIGIENEYWLKAARGILTGAIVLFFNQGMSFIDAMQAIATIPICSLVSMISRDDQAAACVDVSIRQSPQTAAGVSGDLHNYVSVYATDALLREVLSSPGDGSKTPIFWEDLEQGDVFVRIDQSLMEQFSGVMRLMLVQLSRTLERRPEKHTPEGGKIKPTLLLLDEFSQYGKMDTLTSSMRVLRSKNVTFCLFCQSLADIEEIYGKSTQRTILDNCPFQAVLSAYDLETQKYFSDKVGTIKVGTEGASETYGVGGEQTGYSRSISMTSEPAILPHEFGQLKHVVLIHPGPGGYMILKKNEEYRHNPPEDDDIPEASADKSGQS